MDLADILFLAMVLCFSVPIAIALCDWLINKIRGKK